MICALPWKSCNCPWFAYSYVPIEDRLDESRFPYNSHDGVEVIEPTEPPADKVPSKSAWIYRTKVPITPRTVLREPERQVHRSPSPISKPPMGGRRKTRSSRLGAEARASRQIAPAGEERGRSSLIESGRGPSEHVRRKPSPELPPAYGIHDFGYSSEYGPGDVRWAPSDSVYSERKPTPSRTYHGVY